MPRTLMFVGADVDTRAHLALLPGEVVRVATIPEARAWLDEVPADPMVVAYGPDVLEEAARPDWAGCALPLGRPYLAVSATDDVAWVGAIRLGVTEEPLVLPGDFRRLERALGQPRRRLPPLHEALRIAFRGERR